MKSEKLKSATIKTIREAIKKNGSFKFIVRGISMFPLLLDGDEAIIEYIKPEELRVGDIAMYIRKNLMIVHRIIKIYETKDKRRLFIFQGDNLSYPDPPVWQEEIGGKATKIIRGNNVFKAPSFHPIIISSIRFILNRARRIKQLLGLNISHKDIINIIKKR